MDLEKTRITPFPFPNYLAQFLISQLDTPVENIGDFKAKAIHINRNRALGKYILKCLERSDKPIIVKEGITLFVATSINNRINDKTVVEARYCDLILPEKTLQEITSIFEEFFKLALLSFVKGAAFGYDHKKGKENKAIAEFFHIYNIDFDKSALDRAKKMVYRDKINNKKLINRVL